MNQKGWLKNDIYIHGMAWQGLAGQGWARHGMARQGSYPFS